MSAHRYARGRRLSRTARLLSAGRLHLDYALGPPPELVRVGYRRLVERHPGSGIAGGTVAVFDDNRRLVEQAESAHVGGLVERLLKRAAD